jgi:hypothetical protein
MLGRRFVMTASNAIIAVLVCVVLGVTGCRQNVPGPSAARADGAAGGKGGTAGGQGGGGPGGINGTGGTVTGGAGAGGDPGDAGNGPGDDAEDPDVLPPADVPVTCQPGCLPAEVCVDGQCVSPCLPGQTNCPSGCADLLTDPASCGMCGKACLPGEFCSGGACVMACKDGETRCDRSCVNLDNNAKNCGICGKTCAGAEACVGRTCICVAPNQLCNNVCTDVRNNRAHCGQCGNQCQGQLVCNGTSCGCPGGRRVCPNNDEKCVSNLDECCPSGQSWCTNVNRCVDLRSDKQHCNSCTTVCPGDDVCTNRKCICPSTLKDCNGGVCIAPGACCPGKEEMCGTKCIPTADCCSDTECAAVAGQVCNLTTNKCGCPMGQEVCTRNGTSKCIPTVGACCANGDCSGGQTCGANNQCACPAATPKTCMTAGGPRCGVCCPGEMPTGCGANEMCQANLTCGCLTGFRRCGGTGPCVQCCNNAQCADPTKPVCMAGTCAAMPPPPGPLPPLPPIIDPLPPLPSGTQQP